MLGWRKSRIHDNIIPRNQYGFRPDLSTFHEIIDLIEDISLSFDQKNVICVDIVFLDIIKAFDTLNFKHILEMCYESGLRGNCLKIIENYSFKRKQTVLYQQNFSKINAIDSGVPQGGISIPNLFNTTLKDRTNFVKFSNLFIYADDSCLMKPILSLTDI